MKRTILKGLASTLMLVAAGLWSCSTDDGADKTNTLELSSTADAVFNATVTESMYVTVTTDAKEWNFEVTTGEEWIDAYKMNNELEIHPRNNATENQRVGRIKVSAGNAEPLYIMVVQFAPEIDEDVLDVEPKTAITFQEKSNRDVVLSVNTNVAGGYEVDAPEWVILTKAEGTLTVNAEDNDTDATRSGRLTITAGDAAPVYITVVQHNYTEQLESTTAHLSNEEGGADMFVTIQDNEEVQNEIYRGKILISLDTATSDDATITFEVDEEYINEWNFINNKNYELLPVSQVELDNDGTVTIPAGEMEAELEFTVTVNDSQLLYNDYFVLPFSVSETSNNLEVAYADSRVNFAIVRKMQKEVRNVVFPEVNDTNPLNALEVRLPDGQYFFDAVVLFAANINYNQDEDLVFLSNNPNVQALLDNSAIYLQPLREKGIKVYLGLLNNHDRAGLCGLSDWGCQQFAQQIADACLKYGLDGVNMDEEWASYQYSDYGRWFAYPTSERGSRLAYEMKKAMNETCDWPCEVSYFSYGLLSSAYTIEGMQPGEFIDFTVGNYGTSGNSFAGMTLKQCSAKSIECNLGTGGMPSESSARTAKANGYGWFMWFAWDLNPNWSRDRLSYIKQVSKGLYDQEPLDVTGYYKKIGEGQYDPTRYAR